jgi:SSS family transporter
MPALHLSLSGLDLFVLVLYLLACVALGLWVGRGQRDLSDYMVGGRDLPWWAVLGSIVATETSTVTFLSVPGFAYGRDLTFLQLPLGYLIGRLLVVLLFLPQYFLGELFSAYEVLSRRFGGAVRQVASVLFLVMRTLADGLRLYLTAIVVTKVTGLDLSASVLAVGLTTIVYTLFGGIKSVVWTDCLQFVVYVAGALIAGMLIIQKLPGGWNEYLSFAEAHHKFRLIDASFDFTQPYTLWAGIVGGTFLALATHGADQLMVQRYLCARSQRDASRALAVSGLVVFAQFALFLFIGIGLACYYSQYPPPTPFQSNDQVFAAFVVDHLPAGIVGLTLAAIFAAAMSTLSSSLNSSASALMNDLYLPYARRELTPRQQLWLGRGLSALFGAAQIAVGIAGQRLSRSVVESVLSIAGFTTGVILGIFFLGILSKRATRRGALVGLVVGLSVITWVAFGTTLAWPWYSIVGSTTTFLSGLVASWMLPAPDLKNGSAQTTTASPGD